MKYVENSGFFCDCYYQEKMCHFAPKSVTEKDQAKGMVKMIGTNLEEENSVFKQLESSKGEIEGKEESEKLSLFKLTLNKLLELEIHQRL